jgi:hypothetical protein
MIGMESRDSCVGIFLALTNCLARSVLLQKVVPVSFADVISAMFSMNYLLN